jgi:hypothetical protein
MCRPLAERVFRRFRKLGFGSSVDIRRLRLRRFWWIRLEQLWLGKLWGFRFRRLG